MLLFYFRFYPNQCQDAKVWCGCIFLAATHTRYMLNSVRDKYVNKRLLMLLILTATQEVEGVTDAQTVIDCYCFDIYQKDAYFLLNTFCETDLLLWLIVLIK